MTAVIPDLVSGESEVESVGNPGLDLSDVRQQRLFLPVID